MARDVQGELDGRGLRIAIVASRFNSLVVERLRTGTCETLASHGVDAQNIVTVLVPGAFEIPPVARRLAASGEYDAVICLGAVIRGETPHFDHIAGSAAQGIARAGWEGPAPVIFGVLTTDTLEQALDRAGGKAGHKGTEAALAAIEMANVYKALNGESG
ncbi:MAG: 6,7-dimethyl-8-ribityllumazine synthase [Planctomycetota bacterium]